MYLAINNSIIDVISWFYIKKSPAGGQIEVKLGGIRVEEIIPEMDNRK